jgi:hypothetical protein
MTTFDFARTPGGAPTAVVDHRLPAGRYRSRNWAARPPVGRDEIPGEYAPAATAPGRSSSPERHLMGRHEQLGKPGPAAATDGPAGAPGTLQDASSALPHPSHHDAVRAIRDLADAVLASHARAATGDDADDGSSSAGGVAIGVADGSGSLSSAEPLESRSIEVRAVGDGGQMVLEGAPIVYNVPYEVYDRHGAFTEIMAPGVCRGTLSQPTAFLYDHDGLVPARCPGTLTLTDTATSLRCRAVARDHGFLLTSDHENSPGR